MKEIRLVYKCKLCGATEVVEGAKQDTDYFDELLNKKDPLSGDVLTSVLLTHNPISPSQPVLHHNCDATGEIGFMEMAGMILVNVHKI
jgi:hypothetical protein